MKSMYFETDSQVVKLLPIKPKTRISRKDYENLGTAVEPNLEINLFAKKCENQWRLEVFKMNDRTCVTGD
jgi:hypothetical protein